jgi:cytochrome c-type biogenesis protein CcmH/NrfG
MARWARLILASGLVAAGAAAGQDEKRKSEPASEQERQQQDPPEEDERIVARKDYDFNPLQASKEIQIGNFYYRKGSFRAAALRYREATRWNPDDAEAWLKLGETSEKLKDAKAAREAYLKYLELEPDAKTATQIRRKLGKTKE